MTNAQRGFSVSAAQCQSLKAVTVKYKSHLQSLRASPDPPPLPQQKQQLISAVEHMVILIYVISVGSVKPEKSHCILPAQQ